VTSLPIQDTADRADIDPEYMDAQGEADSQLDAPPAHMAPFAVREKDGTIVPYLEKLAEREAAAAEGRTAYLLGAKGDRDLDAMERAGPQLLDDLARRKVGQFVSCQKRS
jgi:hypothetical protein